MAFIINGSPSSSDVVLAPSPSAVGMVGTAANVSSPPLKQHAFGPTDPSQESYRHYQQHFHQAGLNYNNGHQHYHYHHHHSTAGDYYCQPETSGHNGSSGHSRQHSDGHVTVLQIEQNQVNNLESQQQQHMCSTTNYSSYSMHNGSSNGHSNGLESEFVTVLQIAPPTTSNASSHHQPYHQQQPHQKALYMDNRRGEIEEEVTIYRLPGERLGMALRFDGGADSTETIRRVFVQSITKSSPASKAIGLLLGVLRDGDEILQIEGRAASSLTRMECITLLKDAPVRIRLLVRRAPPPPPPAAHSSCNNSQCCCPSMTATNGINGTSQPSCCQMSPRVTSATSEAPSAIHHDHHLATMETMSFSGGDAALLQQRKVPPPVPPRMATTTLSSRRKAKLSPPLGQASIDQLSASDSGNTSSESLTDVQAVNVLLPLSSTDEAASSPPVEKPPRRKNLHQFCSVQSPTTNGHPPPLPPRRPKGPPPKPPTTGNSHSSGSIVSVASSVTLASTSITTTNTKSLPSLVAVITTKVCDGVVSSTSSQSTSSLSTLGRENSAHCLTTPSVTSSLSSVPSSSTPVLSTSNNKSSPIKTSATSKVTFTISNSKVSSFIRQTAEKLHRKLSGNKSNGGSNTAELEEENGGAGKNGHKAANQNNEKPSKSSKSAHSVRVSVQPPSSSSPDDQNSVMDSIESLGVDKKNEEELKPEPVLTTVNTSSSDSSSHSLPANAMPTAAAVYIDCQDMDSNSIFESDTDDTSSSVSTIIERGSSLSNAIFDSLAPHFEQTSSVYFSGHTSIDMEFSSHEHVFKSITSSASSSAMVDRVLSPFERLEREFDGETQQQPFTSLSSFASVSGQSSAPPVNGNDSPTTFRSLSLLSRQSITDDDRSHSPQQSSLSPDKTSALIDRDEAQKQETKGEKEVISLNGQSVACTVESLSSIPVDTVSQRDYDNVPDYLASSKSAESTANETMTSENVEQAMKTPQANAEDVENDHDDGDDDDDDEDFDVIKNDIISRVDDDKDDFMLDTNYLKESSSRFLFHHSGSELILAPYSELSSITEEDEEEEVAVTPTLNTAAAIGLIGGNLTFDNKQPPFTGNFPAVEVPRLPVTASTDYDDTITATTAAATTMTTTNTSPAITSNGEEEAVESKAAMNPASVAPDRTAVEQEKSEAAVKLPVVATIDPPTVSGNGHWSAEEPVKDDTAAVGSQSPHQSSGRLDELQLPEEQNRSTSSHSNSSSSSSSSISSISSPKVSLNNVFDFLNEAADDFEFVERMLELTNDKIDSIDDIMRIRESLRGLQQSAEQRDNLQRFLDGKDVIDELMALSSSSASSSSTNSTGGGCSPTHSTAPSLATNSSASPVLSDVTEGSDRLVMAKLEESYRQQHHHHQHHQQQNQHHRRGQQTTRTANSAANKHQRMMAIEMSEQSSNHDDFVSLPLSFAHNGTLQHHRTHPMQCSSSDANNSLLYSSMYRDKVDFRRLSNGNLSKIPTLTPKMVASSAAPSALSGKRSQSVSNIFQQRSSGYSSLIELRPSLIPRPISNFNLSLPPTSNLPKLATNGYHRGGSHVSHNCLNRSTSMQSIPTNSNFSSLGRSLASKNCSGSNANNRTPGRRSSVTSQLSGSHNYHQHCHRNVEPSPPQYYGSLSRSISKSTANVYSTGSLPRPNAAKPVMGYQHHQQQQQQQHCHKQSGHLGGTSNLSSSQYGSNHLRTSSLSDLTYGFPVNNNRPRQVQQQQQHFSLAGSGALPVKTISSSATASRRHSSSSNLYQCESNHSGEEASGEHTSLHHLHSTPLSKLGKLPGSVLQTSSSLVSLLQPPPPLQPSPPSTNNSHFWHCAHHASSSSLFSPKSLSLSEGSSKRSSSSNNLSASKPTQRTSSASLSLTSALGAAGKGGCKSLPIRKQPSSSSKSLSSSNSYTSSFSSSSSSSSKSSSTESDDQQVPSLQHQHQQQQQQTRSILRHTCITDNSKYHNNKSSYLRVLQLAAKEGDGKKELDFWKQNIIEHQRKRQVTLHYDHNSSHSDSESSDITNSSGDHCTDHCHQHHSLTVHNSNSSNGNKTWQQTKSRRSKVCFIDEIVQHPSNSNNSNSNDTGDIDYRRNTAETTAAAMDVATAGETAVVSRQMRCSDEERQFHEESSSSPEVPVVLSSSTSSSSIASFSSGELGKTICTGSRFRSVKEVLGSNGSLNKSYFLPPTAQREDSGIFASDDTSTSEFSQSPSPELLTGGGSIVKAMQENGEMESETPSMKERIAFFDPASSSQQLVADLSRSYSCNKSSAPNNSPVNGAIGGGSLNNGGILSRSSSAPYETHCELGTKLSQSSSGEDLLLTPPQSPPNERNTITEGKNVVLNTTRAKRLPPPPPPPSLSVQPVFSSLEQQIGSMRPVETTAYPVTVEYSKKPNVPFQSLRDSAITARRFANTCKLKGLVIPQSIIPVHEENSGEEAPATASDRLFSMSTETIDLPTIISKETLKVKNSKVEEEFAASRNGAVDQLLPRSSESEANSPIEFVSLKQAGDSSVPKYSPMFKRRPLSLPLHPEINYGIPKSTAAAAIKTVQPPSIPPLPPVGHKLPPPAVPPKPKVSPIKLEDISPISKVGVEVLPEIEFVVSPKMEDTKKEVESVAPISTVNDDLPVVESPLPPVPPQTLPAVEITEEVKHSKIDCDNQEQTVLPSPPKSPLSQTPTEAPATNEFVIHQRQYSMRAIVFDLTELSALPLGISLTGGLDALNKEVTIEQIEPNSLASQDGRLQQGDRIVSINGKLLLGLTHEETEHLLKSAAHSQQVMIVFSRAHDANGGEVCTPSPSSITSPSILGSMSFPSSVSPGSSSTTSLSTRASSTDLSSNGSSNYKILKAEISKDVNGLGFIIEGGKNPSIGDRPIVIKRIFTGGPVDKEGTLIERDELLSINDQSVQGMTRSEAWHFLKQLPDGQVTLVARRKRYF